MNDNDPAFNQTVYKATLKENSPPGTYVIRVSATDPDKGTNGEVWYQITSGNINDAFVIDNRTGVIVAVAAIDREKFSKYTLVIKAEDKGTPVKRKVCFPSFCAFIFVSFLDFKVLNKLGITVLLH